MPSALPDFENPPLDEVAASIQFEPLRNFHAAHLGLYWARVRSRYPATEDQPPLAHTVEQAEPGPAVANLAFRTGMPVPRSWFVDATQTQLIQLQSDRLLRNWRRIIGSEIYPRFPGLIREFRQEYEGFLDFARAESLGEVVPNQCELTYVNHIEPGPGLTDLSESGRVFSFWKPGDGTGFLPPPEFVNWQTRYKLADGRGRMHVEAGPALRGRDMKLILQLSLTARGAPATNSTSDVFAWFDLAHEWIVRGFDELTDPAMHRLWGKK